MIRKILKTVEKLNNSLENARIVELIELLESKRKIFFRNLLAGISRGLGFSIGFYLITAILIYILQYIVKTKPMKPLKSAISSIFNLYYIEAKGILTLA